MVLLLPTSRKAPMSSRCLSRGTGLVCHSHSSSPGPSPLAFLMAPAADATHTCIPATPLPLLTARGGLLLPLVTHRQLDREADEADADQDALRALPLKRMMETCRCARMALPSALSLLAATMGTMLWVTRIGRNWKISAWYVPLLYICMHVQSK